MLAARASCQDHGKNRQQEKGLALGTPAVSDFVGQHSSSSSHSEKAVGHQHAPLLPLIPADCIGHKHHH